MNTKFGGLIIATEAQIVANCRNAQKSTMNPAAPKNLFMRNKPNLRVFWAVSGDCEEKQTQFKANQSQFPSVKQEKFHALLFTCSTINYLRPKACRMWLILFCLLLPATQHGNSFRKREYFAAVARCRGVLIFIFLFYNRSNSRHLPFKRRFAPDAGTAIANKVSV